VVFAVAVGTKPDVAYVVAGLGVGDGPAGLVAGGRRVGLPGFEVRGGGVEEQQVDFEVEQVDEAVVDLVFEGGGDLVQPVHGPVAGVVGGLGQAGDVHVVGDPVGGGELARRGEGAVGDQGEQYALGGRVAAAPAPGVQECGGDGV